MFDLFQNDLVHGWGLDFALRKCVEVSDKFSSNVFPLFVMVSIFLLSTLYLYMMQPAHEKIGVVDAQWIVHQGVPSLGNQVSPIPY